MVNSCIPALWSLSGTVCGTFYLEHCLCFCSGLQQPARIQPTVAATLWLRHLFLYCMCCGHFVPVAHLFCHALRGLLMIFLVDTLTLKLLFCKSTYCTFVECPQDWLFCVRRGQQIKDDVLRQGLRNQAVIILVDFFFRKQIIVTQY